MLPFWLPAMSLTGRFCGQHFSEENLYIWCQSGSKLEIAKEINRVAMLAARFKKHVRLNWIYWTILSTEKKEYIPNSSLRIAASILFEPRSFQDWYLGIHRVMMKHRHGDFPDIRMTKNTLTFPPGIFWPLWLRQSWRNYCVRSSRSRARSAAPMMG